MNYWTGKGEGGRRVYIPNYIIYIRGRQGGTMKEIPPNFGVNYAEHWVNLSIATRFYQKHAAISC